MRKKLSVDESTLEQLATADDLRRWSKKHKCKLGPEVCYQCALTLTMGIVADILDSLLPDD